MGCGKKKKARTITSSQLQLPQAFFQGGERRGFLRAVALGRVSSAMREEHLPRFGSRTPRPTSKGKYLHLETLSRGSGAAGRLMALYFCAGPCLAHEMPALPLLPWIER